MGYQHDITDIYRTGVLFVIGGLKIRHRRIYSELILYDLLLQKKYQACII